MEWLIMEGCFRELVNGCDWGMNTDIDASNQYINIIGRELPYGRIVVMNHRRETNRPSINLA